MEILPGRPTRRHRRRRRRRVYYLVQEGAGGHRQRPAQRAAVARREQPAGGQLHAQAGRGARKFGKFTQANIGRQLAHRPRQPRACRRRRSRRASPTTAGSPAASRRRKRRTSSLTLRSGALPASLTYLEERTVGPSLGARLDSRRRDRRRSAACVLVVLFMLFYYKLTGPQRHRLDRRQPGHPARLDGLPRRDDDAAGHRRLHPDDRHGRRLERADLRAHQGGARPPRKASRAAVNAGFDRVWWTIVDTHVASLIAAAFLFQFGTGPIRGFATTLIDRAARRTCSRRSSCRGRCSSWCCRARRAGRRR